LAVLLGQVANPSADLAVHWLPAPADLAGVRFQHPEHDPHGGGLAGAVGPDEPEHLVLGHGEREVVQGDQVAVAAGQALQFQHVAVPTRSGRMQRFRVHDSSGAGRCRPAVGGIWRPPRVVEGGLGGQWSRAGPCEAPWRGIGSGGACGLVGAVIAWLNPALLVGQHAQINDAVHMYAGYFISRNLALAVALVMLLALRAHRMLTGVLVLASLVQAFDIVIDATTGRLVLVPALALLTALLLTAASRLSPQPLWRVGAWRSSDPDANEAEAEHVHQQAR
jgi:hypothetical protein